MAFGFAVAVTAGVAVTASSGNAGLRCLCTCVAARGGYNAGACGIPCGGAGVRMTIRIAVPVAVPATAIAGDERSFPAATVTRRCHAGIAGFVSARRRAIDLRRRTAIRVAVAAAEVPTPEQVGINHHLGVGAVGVLDVQVATARDIARDDVELSGGITIKAQEVTTPVVVDFHPLVLGGASKDSIS